MGQTLIKKGHLSQKQHIEHPFLPFAATANAAYRKEVFDKVCLFDEKLLVGEDADLYRKMIVKHLPKVASVPLNETKLPLNASRIRKGLHWRWEGLMRNPFIRATIGRRYARLNDNYYNTHEAIRTGSRNFVEKSIRKNEFLAEFFKMKKVDELLNDHMSGKAHEPTKITALLTFGLWGKMFADNQKPAFQISSNR